MNQWMNWQYEWFSNPSDKLDTLSQWILICRNLYFELYNEKIIIDETDETEETEESSDDESNNEESNNEESNGKRSNDLESNELLHSRFLTMGVPYSTISFFKI